MNKKILVLITSSCFFVTSLFFATPVGAQYGLQETGKRAGYNLSTTGTSMIQTVISTALSLVAIAFLGLAIYAGLRWMTAKGNEERVTHAKDILEAAIVGFIIIVLSYGLSRFIFNRLTANKTGGSEEVVGCCVIYPTGSSWDCSIENITLPSCENEQAKRGSASSPRWTKGGCSDSTPSPCNF